MNWNPLTPALSHRMGCVFSVPAAPRSADCGLLYRRFVTCHPPPASNVLPITNRRYGRLKICATLNGYRMGEDQGEGHFV